MIKELKEFLFQGNVLDLAVAVVMGTAFNAIITSLVSDVITPLFLNPAVEAAGVENLASLKWNGIAYGSFLSAIINFLIIGITLFFVVKVSNKAMAMTKKAEAEAAEETAAEPTEVELLADIKALLAKQQG